MRRFILVVACAAIASGAFAQDITTVDTPTGRYLSVLGKPAGETIVFNQVPASGITGIYDIASAGGNAGRGWEMADGVVDPSNAANTFGDPAATHFQGYMFKHAATITSIDWSNFVYGDGGTFDATPEVQVYDRGTDTWSPVGVTWDQPYVRDFTLNRLTRMYNVSLDAPVVADGIRLIGAPNADGGVGGSPNGWVATAELTVNGAVDFGVELGADLTDLPGTTAIVNNSQFNPANLIDNDLNTLETNVFAPAGDTDYMGVLFEQPQDSVAGFGLTQKFFPDGGWYDSFTIETYDADSDTWTAVTGLDTGRYYDDQPYLVDRASSPDWAVQVETGYLLTFDPVNDVDGIRIIGDGGGTAFGDGFSAASEIEVFQLPEPATLSLLLVTGLLRRRR